MTLSTTSHASRTFELGDGLAITVDEQGDVVAGAGSGVLLLHGGAGPRSVAGFAAALAEHPYVITPTHPGFDGTPRPEWMDSVADLAVAYLDLLDTLDLRDVLVAGSSIGGWIAAEMALRDTRGRIRGLVLLNAVGIQPDDPRDLTDTTTLTPAELSELAFYNPALRLAPSTLSDEQRAMMAANQRTLAVYAGDPYMYDPKLRRRLHHVAVPVLVVWGEYDGIATMEYGRTFADSFPNGHFHPVPKAGHFPHIEQVESTLGAVRDFVNSELKAEGD